jgi:hypothetical protein
MFRLSFLSHLQVVTLRYFNAQWTLLLNHLNAELNPICHLLALLGGATIVDVSRLRVKRYNISFPLILRVR